VAKVIYGGRSTEHDVSLRSAKSVLQYLDKQKFEAVPIAIDKQGQWLLNNLSVLTATDTEQLTVANQHSTKTVFHPEPQSEKHFDVVFPVLHGTLGEDGSVQGLLELADIPYVGCGVLASAMCMDKDISKRLIKQAGVPTPDYLVVREDVMQQLDVLNTAIEKQLSYPVFCETSECGFECWY